MKKKFRKAASAVLVAIFVAGNMYAIPVQADDTVELRQMEDFAGNVDGVNTVIGSGNTGNTSPSAPMLSKSVSISLNGQEIKSGSKIKVTRKKSYGFKSTVVGEDGKVVTVLTGKVVTWLSSKPSVASVNANGKVTVKKTGSTTISAVTSDGKKASVRLKAVKDKVQVSKVKISGKKKMSVGDEQGLKAVVFPITAASQSVKWISSDPKTAYVTSHGRLIADKRGTVTITAVTKNGKKASLKVKIARKLQ